MERHDPLLTRLLEESDGIENFFDNLFSFFQRRTDLLSKPDLARQQLNAKFDKYVEAYNASQRATQREFQRQQAALRREPKIVELDVNDDEATFVTPKNQKNNNKQPDTSSLLTSDSAAAVDETFTPNGNNGYKTDKYSWTQGLDNVEILIPLPRVVKAKECTVKMDAKSLHVRLLSDIILDMTFEEPIKIDESFWTLIDGKVLQVNAEKSGKIAGWWTRAFKGEPELDSSKLVPENSKLSDLDGETRQTVEKMLFDQRQKQLGLPTSEQRQQAELMSKLEAFQKSHPQMDFSDAKITF